MDGSRSSAAPGALSRALTWALGLALLVVAGLVLTAWHRPEWFHTVDSAIYLLTSSSLAEGEGYTYLGRPFFVRPPGLSTMLATVGLAERPFDFAALNRFIGFWAVLALAAVTAVLVRLHGRLVGLGLALAFALNPLFVGSLNKVIAELPFTALFYAGLWLLLERRRPAEGAGPLDAPVEVPEAPASGDATAVGPGRGALAAAVLLLVVSLYVRTIGVLLVPALVLHDLLRRRGRPGARSVAALLLVLGVLPWVLHGRAAAEQAEKPSTQLLMYDYATAYFHVDTRDPDSALVDLDGWKERVAGNAAELSRFLTYAFTGRPFDGLQPLGTFHAVGGALVALALLVTWVGRRSLADLYAAAYAVLLLTYFTTTDRLLAPALPLVLSAMAFALGGLGRLLEKTAPGTPVRSLLLSLAGLGYLAVVVPLIGPALQVQGLRVVWKADDLHTAAWVEEHLPEDARLLHERGAILSVLTGRTTYTFRNLPGPWPRGAPEVDWALFSPRPGLEPAEKRIREVAPPPVSVPFDWMGRPSTLRVYDLRDVDQTP